MKKHYTFIALLLFYFGHAQIINFTDPDFKNALLGSPSTGAFSTFMSPITVDTNGNGEIEQSEALAVTVIGLTGNTAIDDLTGIEYFTNLNTLQVGGTSITALNASTLVNLANLRCDGAQLTSLDLSHCMLLETLYCQNNQLTSLVMPEAQTIWRVDCSSNLLTTFSVGYFGNPAGPRHFSCANNQLTEVNLRGTFDDIDVTGNQLVTLDLSHCTTFMFPADFNYNPNLVAVNFKNGHNESGLNIAFFSVPNLRYLCVDDTEFSTFQNYINTQGQSANVHLNSYCSFGPGGNYASITGNVRFDADNNGCDASDVNVPGFKITASDGMNPESAYFSGADGHYAIDLVGSFYQMTPWIEHPEYFTVSPGSFLVDLFNQTSAQQDICITANGTHHNVSVALLPLNDPRPGMPANYRIVCRNIGTTTESGTAVFDYDEALTDFAGSSIVPTVQSAGHLSWNYANLQPMQSQTIDVTLNVNSPTSIPPVDSGTQLSGTASITASSDEATSDNTATLLQTVVNSLDPNDKVCLEGDTVKPEMAGKYVHYLIRFENTGTANALKVVVSDVIDTNKFDLSSLVPLHGSHDYRVRITGNKVDFFFENINLPFDDTHNDGYIAFMIKTKPELVLGDTFSNTASIYFDYNFPIVTNTATTTLALLQTQDFVFSDHFSVFPNPASQVLNIRSKTEMAIRSVSIYSMTGQLVMSVPNAKGIQSVDISTLQAGNYILHVDAPKGASNLKFVKQ